MLLYEAKETKQSQMLFAFNPVIPAFHYSTIPKPLPNS